MVDSLAKYGVGPVDVFRWTKAGVLRFDCPTPGYPRIYPPEEARALLAVDAVRRLAGVNPQNGGREGGAHQMLRRLVAEAARSNPPYTQVEITTPVPWIRHVLIVPDVPA